jgi:hypothetical protein
MSRLAGMETLLKILLAGTETCEDTRDALCAVREKFCETRRTRLLRLLLLGRDGPGVVGGVVIVVDIEDVVELILRYFFTFT